jgi:ATP-dependent exoDNAse (exonuclease V) beta subunit
MMTIHGAKGLEFHYVFIAGLGKLALITTRMIIV